GGCADRGADQGRAPRSDGRPDDVHRGPPAVDDLARRRDRGDGSGSDRRSGNPRAAPRALPALRGDRAEGPAGFRLRPAASSGAGAAGEAVNECDGAQVFLALFRSLWRLIRGEDNRGRKVRWLFSLLRPSRRQVLLTLVALVLATAATLAPP